MVNPHIIFTTAGRATALLLACAAALLSTAALAADDMLDAQPWKARAYGLSMRPPIDAVRQPWPTANTRMRFLGNDGYTIDVLIRKKRDPSEDDSYEVLTPIPGYFGTADRFHLEIRTEECDVTLQRVETIAIEAMKMADPYAVMIDRKDLKPGGLSATVVYFKLAPTKVSFTPAQKRATPWVMGLGFIQVQHNTFAVLRLQVDEIKFGRTRLLFEAMMQSLRLESNAKLTAQRKKLIERGELWHQLIDREKLRDSLMGEQWFRLLNNNVDIGYLQLLQRQTTEMNLPGSGVAILATVVRNKRAYNSESRFFLSDDGDHEIWSIKTAVRPAGRSGRPDFQSKGINVATWTETGYRSYDHIEVKREGPHGITTRQWPRPPKAYLAQVEMHLMGALLPRQTHQELAFYAYHPNTGRIMLRTITVLPGSGGSYRVVARPSLDHPQDTTYYDAEGRFLRRELQGGIVIQRTSPTELRVIWNLKTMERQ